MTYKDYTNFALLMIESASDQHNPELAAEICHRAGLLEEWNSADGETFESYELSEFNHDDFEHYYLR